MRAQIHAHTRRCMHTCMHTCIHTLTHRHTDTQTDRDTSSPSFFARQAQEFSAALAMGTLRALEHFPTGNPRGDRASSSYDPRLFCFFDPACAFLLHFPFYFKYNVLFLFFFLILIFFFFFWSVSHHTDRHTDIHTYRQKYRSTGRHTDRPTYINTCMFTYIAYICMS